MRIPLLSASYTSESLAANAQRCVNLYPESNPPDSPAPSTFYACPGLLLWSTMPGSGPVRMLFRTSTGTLFGVQGTKLYYYVSSSWTELATLATSTGPVSAAENGVSAVFVDGTTTAPTVNLTTFAVGALSGDGWLGADNVHYCDGFFVFNKPSSQIYYISGAINLELDPLDFASAEAMPDRLVSHLVTHSEIWLFGDELTEVHANSGGADFPFARINSAVFPIGCAAKYSPAKFDNTVVWLGRNANGDAMVWQANGYNPQRISTHALEAELNGYSTIADAQSYVYQQNGHTFYVLTFPTANKTWCFDAATRMWHERVYRDSSNGYNRHRSNCYAFYERLHLVGDFENGKIYQFDPATFTDNGDVIPRIKSFQHMVTDGRRQFFAKFEPDMEWGVGNTADPDPQISLRWSDDGGHTWSSTLTRSIGKVGEYNKRPVFNRLGSARDRVFEFATTAQVKIVLQGAFIDVQVGTS